MLSCRGSIVSSLGRAGQRGGISGLHEGRAERKNIYITGEHGRCVFSSFFLKNLRKKGLEVLYIVCSVDEYAVQEAESHNDGELDFGDRDEKNKFES